MGNESSTLIDEKTPPSVLEARTIEAIAKYVKQKPVKRVVVMVWTFPSDYPSPAPCQIEFYILKD